MGHNADIDIDFGNRDEILQHIKFINARKSNKDEKHNSGIYVQPIPYDSEKDCATINFKEADTRGYFKLDFLNVFVYKLIRNEDHYQKLLNTEPPWNRLKEKEFVQELIHISNYPDLAAQLMPDSIPRMAMFLSLLRPGKKHLIGKSWKEIGETIWVQSDDGYSFRKSHAVAYAHLVALHMNILNEKSK